MSHTRDLPCFPRACNVDHASTFHVFAFFPLACTKGTWYRTSRREEAGILTGISSVKKCPDSFAIPLWQRWAIGALTCQLGEAARDICRNRAGWELTGPPPFPVILDLLNEVGYVDLRAIRRGHVRLQTGCALRVFRVHTVSAVDAALSGGDSCGCRFGGALRRCAARRAGKGTGLLRFRGGQHEELPVLTRGFPFESPNLRPGVSVASPFLTSSAAGG